MKLSCSIPGLLVLFLFAVPVLAEETLESQLKARQTEAAARMPEEVVATFEEGIRAVADSGILKTAKQVGDRAPDFTLENATGKKVSLHGLLEKGPVILTWYRGGWCPFCNLSLAALQKKLPEFQAAGARLVALTPELPDKALNTAEKNALKFEVLTDLNHGVAKTYGIVFKLTPQVRDLYKKFFDLTEFNGAEAGDDTLPLAATYIISQDGIIRYAFLDADYRKRAEPSELADFVKKLSSNSKP